MTSDEAPRFHPDAVDSTAFLAPTATVIGDVSVGARASIWFGAVIRGDTESIRIGADSNVQDLCVLHADPGFPCILGERVTVGHAAVVHGAVIEDDVLIGIRSVVMNGARIGAGSLVGVGAVVTEGTEVPPGSVVMGVPARVIRKTLARDAELIRYAAEHYVSAGERYRQRPDNGHDGRPN